MTINTIADPVTAVPIKDAIIALLKADMPAALDYVCSFSGVPRAWVTNPRDNAYDKITIRRYHYVKVWPAVMVNAYAWRTVRGQWGEGNMALRWSPVIEVDVFVKEDRRERISDVMDTYGAAVWHVIGSAERIAGWLIDYESAEIEVSEPGGASENMRAVEVRFRLQEQV